MPGILTQYYYPVAEIARFPQPTFNRATSFIKGSVTIPYLDKVYYLEQNKSVLNVNKFNGQLKNMTVILTNDDGVDAPGIEALWQAIALSTPPFDSLGKTIVVAPQQEVSGCGHQITTKRPIQVRRRKSAEKINFPALAESTVKSAEKEEYAIAGTPADCARIGITHICPDVNWIFSGINSGGNMGVDSYISGTIAAVREAAFHRIGGIAISQYRKAGKPVDWEKAISWVRLVLADLLNRELEPGAFWNVNFPYLEPGKPEPEIIFCSPSSDPLPVAYKVEGENFYYVGKYDLRDRTPGTDVDVCLSGNIAVTKIHL